MKLHEWVQIANNPQTGVSTWAYLEEDGVTIQERQDVGALLDENTAIRNINNTNWKGDGLHSIARVPLAMLHDTTNPIAQAVKEGDDKYVLGKLNDGDFAKLRTKEGNL